jgi:putative flippase GtrA
MEFVRYLLVGFVNTLFGYSLFLVFYKIGNLSPEYSNAASYMIALLLAYVLNRIYVFSDKSISKINLLKFIISFIVAYFLNFATLWLLLKTTETTTEIVQLIAMAIYTVTFYILNKFYVFRCRAS